MTLGDWAWQLGPWVPVVIIVVRWLMTRGDREARRLQAEIKTQQAITVSDEKLRAELRDELRRDLVLLKEKDAANEARINDLVRLNENQRRENMDLKGQNGAQAEQLATQSARIMTLENQVRELQVDREILTAALRNAGIPLPVELYRKPNTGPLGSVLGKGA